MKSDFSFSSHIIKKYSLFHILLASLIGGDSKVGWIEILFKVISEVQFLAMLLLLPFELFDNSNPDALGEFVKGLCEIITFKDIFIFNSNSIWTNIFLGASLTYIGLLVMYVLGMVISFYANYPFPIGIIKIWINMCVIHFTCMFLYILECSLGMIKSASDHNVYLFGVSDSPDLFVWLGVIIVVINIVFGIATAKFVYEPIKSSYIAAVRTTLPDFLSLFYKTMNVAFRLFITDFVAQKWLRIVLALVVLSYKLKVYIYSTPYYYFGPMRLFQALTFLEASFSWLIFIVALINESKTIKSFAVIYMCLVFGAFFSKLSDVVLMEMIKKYGMKDITEVKSKDDFYKKLFSTDYILENGSISATIEKKQRENFTEFLYYGVIKAHKNVCKKDLCGCNLVLEKGSMTNGVPIKEEQRRLMREFKFSLIFDLFERFMDPEVKVTLANFLFENKVQAYAAAITIIHSLNLDKSSIELRVIRAKLLEKIESKVLTNYDSAVNTQEIIDYQRLSYDFRKAVESNLSKFLKFWEIYREAEPNISDLFKTSVNINQEADDINQIWASLISKYSKLSYQDHLLYGLYQSLVRSAPFTAEKVLQKYFSLSRIYSTQRNRSPLITPDNVFEPQNVVAYILMDKKQIGNVVFVTPNIEASLNYSPEDLINKNINTIMPGFYKERHNRILLAHVEESRSTIINRNRLVFAQKKNGFITPVTLYVSIFPYFQKQLIYVGILRPVQTFDEFMIVLPNGLIDAFSENVAKTLQLDAEQARRYHLRNISKELENYAKAFEYLRNGDREKLRTVVYTRKTHSSASGKNTNATGPGASAFGPSETTFMHKETIKKKETNMTNLTAEAIQQQMAEKGTDLFQDPEFEEWIRLYELFTSTGVPILFNKYTDKGVKINNKAGIEFNTILIEESILHTKASIFRLQSVSVDPGENEDYEFEDFEEEGGEKSEGTEKESQATSVMDALKGKAKKARRDSSDPNTFSQNTFPQNTFPTTTTHFIKTEIPATEERGLLESRTPDNLTNLLKEAEAQKKINNVLNDEDCNLPDDHEIGFLNSNVGLLKNPLLTKMISSSTGSTTANLKVPEENNNVLEKRKDPLEFIFEKNETGSEEGSQDRDQLSSNLNRLGISSSLQRQTSTLGLNIDPLDLIHKGSRINKGKSKSSSDLSSDNRSSGDNEKEPEHKQKLRRFFKDHKLLALEGGGGNDMNAADAQDRSSVSSSTKSSRVSSKVERAIYVTAPDLSLKILNILAGLFCVAGVGMIIYYLVIANTNIERVRANVEVQKYSTQRLYLIVEINRRTRIVNIIESGLSQRNRSSSSSDDTVISLTALPNLADELSFYNNEIRLSINKIDKTEQQRFYETIPVKERDNPSNIRYLNSFDTCTEIVNSVFRLNSLLPDRPAYNNPDLTFILGNVLNNLVVNNEDVANILLDDNQISLSKVETTVLILMILTVGVAVCIFAFAFRSERHFMQRKMAFLDSFLRIKEYEIENTLLIVHNFHAALQENNQDDKFMQKIVNDDKYIVAGKKAENNKEHRGFKAKSANIKGVNSTTYANLILILIFILAFTASFGILLGIFVSYETSINKLMLRVINTNINLFQLGLVFSSLYEYISENGRTMIRNQPIDQEWERLYQVLTGSSDFFTSFDDQDEAFNNQMLALLSGDLCLTLFKDARCQNNLSRVAMSGILGINTFILKSLRGLKDLYDNSDRTLASEKSVLMAQDFLDVETVYSYYTSDSYKSLDALLTTQFFLEIDDFLKRSLIMGVISVVAILVLVKLLWMKVVVRMEDDRKNFRGILRVIPINIVLANRYLKSYLMRNSDKVLDSIKNKI